MRQRHQEKVPCLAIGAVSKKENAQMKQKQEELFPA